MSRDVDAPLLPLIDVVICAYTSERFDDLNAAIDSVLAQDPGAHGIVVVIDHNDDLLERMAVRTDVTVVPNVHAKGLSGARNTGLENCTADAVAFLDDDAAARPGWLGALAEVLADPAVAGAGGTVVAAWDAGRPGWFPAEFDWVVGCTHSGMPTTVESIRNPVGASMAFRAGALKSAGGFDEGLGRVGKRPVGCEETELSITIRRNYGPDSIRMAPASIVDHRVPAERGHVGYFLRRCWAEGRSKAVVTNRTSADEGLESERTYVTRTLPAAVVRGFLRPGAGWGRALAIIVGTAVTTVGFALGRFRRTTSVTADAQSGSPPHREAA